MEVSAMLWQDSPFDPQYCGKPLTDLTNFTFRNRKKGFKIGSKRGQDNSVLNKNIVQLMNGNGTGSLQRCKGQWRDAGFWQKVVSPGGTKSFRRRSNYLSVCGKENMEACMNNNDKDVCPLITAANTDDELFTDDWQSALKVQYEDTSRSSTLPRNLKCRALNFRQSLPAPPVNEKAEKRSSSPVMERSSSPYSLLITRLKNRSSRLYSPGKCPPKYAKSDLDCVPIPNTMTRKASTKPHCQFHGILPAGHVNYTSSLLTNLNAGSSSSSSSCDGSGSSNAVINNAFLTLPRPGLTKLPPTPPSPRRNSSWWARLSPSGKDLGRLSPSKCNRNLTSRRTTSSPSLDNLCIASNTDNKSTFRLPRAAMASQRYTANNKSSTLSTASLPQPLPPDVILHGPDVAIDWVSTYSTEGCVV